MAIVDIYKYSRFTDDRHSFVVLVFILLILCDDKIF